MRDRRQIKDRHYKNEKHNPEKANSTKYSKTKLAWFKTPLNSQTTTATMTFTTTYKMQNKFGSDSTEIQPVFTLSNVLSPVTSMPHRLLIESQSTSLLDTLCAKSLRNFIYHQILRRTLFDHKAYPYQKFYRKKSTYFSTYSFDNK